MAEVQRPILPNLLYRYRSLTRSAGAFQEELDSILKRYLYCCQFVRANDPMEGFYQPSEILKGRPDYKDIVRQITNSKSTVGLACLTETHEDVLMWTHYAGNYTGICLVYSTQDLLDGLPHHVNLVRLAYVDNPPIIYPDEARNADNAAIRILSQKKYNWAYEREWRVLGPVGQVSIGREQAVKEIYFGSRANLQHRQKILAKIQGTGIKAYMMDVDGYGHRWEPINAAAKSREKLS